jgi:hypothetical protein
MSGFVERLAQLNELLKGVHSQINDKIDEIKNNTDDRVKKY